MKVLHYISSLYVSLPLSEEVENKVITLDDIRAPRGNSFFEYITFYKKISAIISEAAPDVVHVYGSWDILVGIVALAAHKRNKVIVFSPMRGITQHEIHNHFWKRRLWQLLAYQLWTLQLADVVIAIDNYEKSEITLTRLRKTRIEILPEATTLSPKAPEEFLRSIYYKALDSAYTRYITPQEKQLVYALFETAIRDSEEKIEPPYMQNMSFRRIALYAFDEDVTDLMLKGAEMQEIELPELIDVAKTPRYPNPHAKPLGSLKSNNTVGRPAVNPNNTEDYAVELLLQAKNISLSRLTMHHWAELYELFRYTDFDEDAVEKELNNYSLKRTTKKIQKRLTEYFQLKPGYCIY